MATRVEVDLPQGDKCLHCGATKYAVFETWGSGYSAGSGHHHKPDCKSLFCPHGQPRSKAIPEGTCAECMEAVRQEALDDVE